MFCQHGYHETDFRSNLVETYHVSRKRFFCYPNVPKRFGYKRGLRLPNAGFEVFFTMLSSDPNSCHPPVSVFIRPPTLDYEY